MVARRRRRLRLRRPQGGGSELPSAARPATELPVPHHPGHPPGVQREQGREQGQSPGAHPHRRLRPEPPRQGPRRRAASFEEVPADDGEEADQVHPQLRQAPLLLLHDIRAPDSGRVRVVHAARVRESSPGHGEGHALRPRSVARSFAFGCHWIELLTGKADIEVELFAFRNNQKKTWFLLFSMYS